MKQRIAPKVRRVTDDDLRQEIADFEAKYCMTSNEFYAKFEAAEFADDGSDQFFDFMT